MNFFEDLSAAGAKKVFLVGIGGIGMSGIARLLKAKGLDVAGSDSTASALTDELEKEGIPVRIGHDPEEITNDTELLIFSAAVLEDNPERRRAKELGLQEMTYAEALGELTALYRLVAISGTHGKTTTTAMLGLILEAAGLDPSVLVGSKVREFGNSNVRIGNSDIFVVEACEYKRNFMSLRPSLLAVLNMEFDHMDYFKDFEDYRSAFEALAAQSEEVLWPDEIAEYEGEVGVPGYHNLLNAGAAAHLARRLGAREEAIAEALKNFTGIWRRFEYKGELNGAPVYEDYAHHPTEIIATLEAAREKYPEERLVVVYQPHQYSRTAGLLGGFAEAFEEADEVIIPNIYEVRDRDSDKRAGSVEKLVAAIGEHHENVKDGGGFAATVEYLRNTVKSGDLVFVMGAGDITDMVTMLMEEF